MNVFSLSTPVWISLAHPKKKSPAKAGLSVSTYRLGPLLCAGWFVVEPVLGAGAGFWFALG